MSMSSKSVRPIKIAFVKQEVYQDLYVHRAGETDAAALLTSSMARVGPIGLFTQLGAQAYIVKLDAARECQIFRKVCPKVASVVEGLREKPLNELPGQEFWQPGSSTPPGHYAESAWNIDWSQFDIVFCINIPLPKAVVRRYPRTLFAYMIGEYNALTSDVPRYGYDVSLVQRPSMTVQNKMGVLDFPYTFLGPTCLEDIMRQVLGRSGEKNGLYAEINMSKERPVVECPSVLREFARPDFPVRLHRQHIMQNLELIYDAKFFVKLGGRVIQGNSIAEAISTGTLVLANPDEVRHKELLPEFTCIQDANDLKAKINFLSKMILHIMCYSISSELC